MLNTIRHMIYGNHWFKKYQQLDELYTKNVSEYTERIANLATENYELKKIINTYIEYPTYDVVNADLFLTIKYQNKMKEVIENKKLSDDKILIMFNKLIDEEKKYLEGIFDCIKYARYRKNKGSALHKQLAHNFLTELGKSQYELM